MEDQLSRIENKIDLILERQDNHGQRIATSEAHISWLRGAVKTSISILLAVITGAAGMFYPTITGK